MPNGQKDILQLLTQNIQKGDAQQQNVIGNLLSLVGGLAPGGAPDPLQALRALGVLSTARPGVKGEAGRVAGEATKQVLNPLQENVLKSVQKVHKEQIEESMAQGASGEQVLRDAGISIASEQPTDEEGKSDGTALALTGVQPPELTQPTQFTDAGRNLLQSIGIDLSQGLIKQPGVGPEGQVTPGTSLFGLIQESAKSQLARQQTVNLRPANQIALELAKKGSVDALKPESAGKFNLLIEGANATAGISKRLNSNVTAQLFAQGVPNFLKSQEAKLLQAELEIAVQDRTRIETGAALQPSELKSTAKRFMPQKGDELSTALQRLKPLFDFFEGSLRVADPTGIHKQRARGQTQSGIQSAIKAARKKGAVGFDTNRNVFVDSKGNEVK